MKELIARARAVIDEMEQEWTKLEEGRPAKISTEVVSSQAISINKDNTTNMAEGTNVEAPVETTETAEVEKTEESSEVETKPEAEKDTEPKEVEETKTDESHE